MKKNITSILVIALMLSACSSPESGAINGASFGSIFGGALGGIIGGPRGHNIGTMVGLITGGASGAAVGAQQRAERRERALTRAEDERQRYEQTEPVQPQRRSTMRKRKRNRDIPNERYETTPIDVANEPVATSVSPLQLRNLRFIGENGNQTIDRGETCQLVFELANSTGRTINNIVPYIHELNGNEHLAISPSTRIESIANGDAIRYTATIRADNKLKEGTAVFRIAVSTDEEEFVTLRDFSIGLGK